MMRHTALAAVIATVAAGAQRDSDAISLKLGLPLRNTDELNRVFTAVSDPDGPEYLNFITDPSDLAAMLGADNEAIDATVSYLVDDLGCDIDDVVISAVRDYVMCKSLPRNASSIKNPSLFWDNALEAPIAESMPYEYDFVLQKKADSAPQIAELRREAGLVQELGVNSAGQLGSFYSVENTKKAYGIPTDLQASNNATTQMVWGPGTFGYSKLQLEMFKKESCPLLNMDRVVFDTANHGEAGGDNFGEGNLDVKMTSAFGLNVLTVVSNTNTSSATEEGNGFGEALLDFVTDLYQRSEVPHVLSMSLGSLSAASCNLLCAEAVKQGESQSECEEFLQEQRQVCMYLTEKQTQRINQGLQILGSRGITVLGSSGDGGSHFSFGQFSGGHMAEVLNDISCEFQLPVFPTASPYVLSVGGEQWKDGDMSQPIAWDGSGGGFSWQFPALAHQTATVANYLQTTHGLPAASSYNASGRAYPDVAAISTDGTSQSCPTVAGILSLVIDHRLNQGLPPLGFIAPRLYKVATEFPGEAFQDIPSGNTKTVCDNGFPATSSWDPVTGWGRPQWSGLLKHFGSDNSTSRRSI